MISIQTAEQMMREYPETSLFEWYPRLQNLIPEDRTGEAALDTPEFRHAAFNRACKTGINPLGYWLGSNPLYISENVQAEEIPWRAYEAPPPLPRVELEDPVFLRNINPYGNTPLFEIRSGNISRVLKVFVSKTSPEWWNGNTSTFDPQLSLRLYHAEKDAYAHLRHSGACDAGVVPQCFGWLQLSREVASQLSIQFKLYWELADADEDLPYALLLEHFADAVQISVQNVTFPMAEKALRALYVVHKSYVQHGDISRRNILLLPDGRIIWIDFDASKCASDPNLRRQDLWDEARGTWGLFYQSLLPGARIGWASRFS
ncbi:unnamed protein product [Somion occarium]|uniref:Non-specific serine/threonine protein kinase n=1 Tax=Somion occarium TaxID=3059160 RepID=A0ABP1CQU0_9APHY